MIQSMDRNVFIPSRGRWEQAPVIAKAWHAQGFTPHFVVEPDEALSYCAAVEDCQVHPLEFENGGIGHSRMHCVNLAASWGCKSIVLCDDDIKPNPKYLNMGNFMDSAAHSKVLGITARYGYHDLCLGALIKDRNDLILLPTGTFRLVALNVRNVLEIGNYDRHLEYAEDCDLFLRGLQAGFPWLIHLGTRSISVGTRYQPGGMLDFAGGEDELADRKEHWHETLYERYPDIVNDPAKADFTKQNSIRISWRKAYDKYLPGWKKWSALHGGYLAHYLGLAKPVNVDVKT